MAVDIFSSPVPRLPSPGDLVLSETIEFFPGGNALNAAVALLRLGESVSFFGVLGTDSLGDLLVRQLEALGLDLRGVHREPGGATPATLIYRREGEDRRFLHALGVAERFSGENFPLELIPQGGVVLAGGYLKLPDWGDRALGRVLHAARERGCRVVLNVCVPRGGRTDPGRLLRVLPMVDVFLPNEDEALALTGEEHVAAQARRLRNAGARLVIITRGPRGLYAENGEQIVEMGAYSVPTVDPSGCGDCFAGGVAAAVLHQWDTVRTLKFGSAVGALGATALGCTAGVPSLEDVECFVEKNIVKVMTRYANAASKTGEHPCT
jgi:sugar/nucleoside kinase (ribokinase family)